MIGELALWLMVYASDPNTGKKYEIEDRQISIEACTTEECISDKCIEAERPWIAKSLKVHRGDWVLRIACQLEHDDGTPASLQEEVKPDPPLAADTSPP